MTAAQLRLIYKLSSNAGIDSEQLHGIIEVRFGKTSLKSLTKTEAGIIIKLLTPESASVVAGPSGGEFMATEKQLKYIKSLAEAAGIKNLNAYLKKRHTCSDIKWLTKDKATSVITGLKKQGGAIYAP